MPPKKENPSKKPTTSWGKARLEAAKRPQKSDIQADSGPVAITQPPPTAYVREARYPRLTLFIKTPNHALIPIAWDFEPDVEINREDEPIAYMQQVVEGASVAIAKYLLNHGHQLGKPYQSTSKGGLIAWTALARDVHKFLNLTLAQWYEQSDEESGWQIVTTEEIESWADYTNGLGYPPDEDYLRRWVFQVNPEIELMVQQYNDPTDLLRNFPKLFAPDRTVQTSRNDDERLNAVHIKTQGFMRARALESGQEWPPEAQEPSEVGSNVSAYPRSYQTVSEQFDTDVEFFPDYYSPTPKVSLRTWRRVAAKLVTSNASTWLKTLESRRYFQNLAAWIRHQFPTISEATLRKFDNTYLSQLNDKQREGFADNVNQLLMTTNLKALEGEDETDDAPTESSRIQDGPPVLGELRDVLRAMDDLDRGRTKMDIPQWLSYWASVAFMRHYLKTARVSKGIREKVSQVLIRARNDMLQNAPNTYLPMAVGRDRVVPSVGRNQPTDLQLYLSLLDAVFDPTLEWTNPGWTAWTRPNGNTGPDDLEALGHPERVGWAVEVPGNEVNNRMVHRYNRFMQNYLRPDQPRDSYNKMLRFAMELSNRWRQDYQSQLNPQFLTTDLPRIITRRAQEKVMEEWQRNIQQTRESYALNESTVAEQVADEPGTTLKTRETTVRFNPEIIDITSLNPGKVTHDDDDSQSTVSTIAMSPLLLPTRNQERSMPWRRKVSQFPATESTTATESSTPAPAPPPRIRGRSPTIHVPRTSDLSGVQFDRMIEYLQGVDANSGEKSSDVIDDLITIQRPHDIDIEFTNAMRALFRDTRDRSVLPTWLISIANRYRERFGLEAPGIIRDGKKLSYNWKKWSSDMLGRVRDDAWDGTNPHLYDDMSEEEKKSWKNVILYLRSQTTSRPATTPDSSSLPAPGSSSRASDAGESDQQPVLSAASSVSLIHDGTYQNSEQPPWDPTTWTEPDIPRGTPRTGQPRDEGVRPGHPTRPISISSGSSSSSSSSSPSPLPRPLPVGKFASLSPMPLTSGITGLTGTLRGAKSKAKPLKSVPKQGPSAILSREITREDIPGETEFLHQMKESTPTPPGSQSPTSTPGNPSYNPFIDPMESFIAYAEREFGIQSMLGISHDYIRTRVRPSLVDNWSRWDEATRELRTKQILLPLIADIEQERATRLAAASSSSSPSSLSVPAPAKPKPMARPVATNENPYNFLLLPEAEPKPKAKPKPRRFIPPGFLDQFSSTASNAAQRVASGVRTVAGGTASAISSGARRGLSAAAATVDTAANAADRFLRSDTYTEGMDELIHVAEETINAAEAVAGTVNEIGGDVLRAGGQILEDTVHLGLDAARGAGELGTSALRGAGSLASDGLRGMGDVVSDLARERARAAVAPAPASAPIPPPSPKPEPKPKPSDAPKAKSKPSPKPKGRPPKGRNETFDLPPMADFLRGIIPLAPQDLPSQLEDAVSVHSQEPFVRPRRPRTRTKPPRRPSGKSAAYPIMIEESENESQEKQPMDLFNPPSLLNPQSTPEYFPSPSAPPPTPRTSASLGIDLFDPPSLYYLPRAEPARNEGSDTNYFDAEDELRHDDDDTSGMYTAAASETSSPLLFDSPTGSSSSNSQVLFPEGSDSSVEVFVGTDRHPGGVQTPRDMLNPGAARRVVFHQIRSRYIESGTWRPCNRFRSPDEDDSPPTQPPSKKSKK